MVAIQSASTRQAKAKVCRRCGFIWRIRFIRSGKTLQKTCQQPHPSVEVRVTPMPSKGFESSVCWTKEMECLRSLCLNPANPCHYNLQSFPHTLRSQKLILLVIDNWKDGSEPIGEGGSVVGRSTMDLYDALV